MKKLTSILLVFALICTLVGCGQSAVESAPSDTAVQTESNMITVTDMIGRELSIVPGSYRRVVCIGAGALRMYSYIAGSQWLCGVEDIDNLSLEDRPKMFDAVARPYVLAYGEDYKSLPSCGVGGPMAQTAEAEKILSCAPDLVISEYEDVEKADALQAQLGVPVVTLKAGADGVFDEAFSGSMNLLGQVLDMQSRALELVEYVRGEKKAISAATAEIAQEEKPSVYICGLGNWGTTNHLMTAENYASFQVANVKNVLSGTGAKGVQPIEEEKFVALGENMDIMFLDAAAVKNILPLYQENPNMFDGCKAWEQGNVYLEMAYNAYYTNFEIALLNTWFIAKTVYPEVFAEVDMMEKTNEVTRMFLGRELAEEIFACPSSFGGYQQVDTATFFE